MSQLARKLQSEMESLESARREALETLHASQLASAEAAKAAQAQAGETAAREKTAARELGDLRRESQTNVEVAARMGADLRVVKAECDELRAAAARGREAAAETDGLRSLLAAREAEARRAVEALNGMHAQLDDASAENCSHQGRPRRGPTACLRGFRCGALEHPF